MCHGMQEVVVLGEGRDWPVGPATCGEGNIPSRLHPDLTPLIAMDAMTVVTNELHLHLLMDPAVAHLEEVHPGEVEHLLLIVAHLKETAHHLDTTDPLIIRLKVPLLLLQELHRPEATSSSNSSLTRKTTLCLNLMISTPCGVIGCELCSMLTTCR